MSDINYKIKDYSIEQGKIFNRLQDNYINIVGEKSMNLIEETTGNNLGSLYEGMETMDNDVLTKQEEKDISKLKEIEIKFNQTLQEYKDTYKAYLNEKTDDTDLKKIYGKKNVYDGNKNKYFVNNYGYTRGYSDWDNKGKSCPQSEPEDNSVDIYNKLMHGISYSSGQPCNLDGKNIRNKNSKEISWISPDGYRHSYPSEEIYKENQKNGCPSDEILVNEDVYFMFPEGEKMTIDSKCFKNHKENALYNKVERLNTNLMEIVTEMNEVIEKLEKQNTGIKNNLSKEKTIINTEISNLGNYRKKMEELRNTVEKLDGELQGTQIVTKSEYIHYMIWTIGAISLGIYAVRHMS